MMGKFPAVANFKQLFLELISKFSQLHVAIFWFFCTNLRYIPRLLRKMMGNFRAVVSFKQLFLELKPVHLQLASCPLALPPSLSGIFGHQAMAEWEIELVYIGSLI